MKNYNKIFSQLGNDLAKAADDCELLKDILCVVRLEQRAIHFLIDSNIKNLKFSVSILISIFMAEVPHKNWDECLEILKKRKPEWW